jgi:hypothetical protein
MRFAEFADLQKQQAKRGLTNPKPRGPLFPGACADQLPNSLGFQRQRRENIQDPTRVLRMINATI